MALARQVDFLEGWTRFDHFFKWTGIDGLVVGQWGILFGLAALAPLSDSSGIRPALESIDGQQEQERNNQHDDRDRGRTAIVVLLKFSDD